MNISILTLFPELYAGFLNTSLIKRAQDGALVDIGLVNLFDFCDPKQRIDSPSFGPGAGMLLRPDVVSTAVEECQSLKGPAFKIFFSPQGVKLDQQVLKRVSEQIAQKSHVLLFASRYEGLDARVEHEYADLTISIGDYVLMGGDLPAMVFLEGLLRYLPGVVGKAESVAADSFSGPLLDYPEYAHPVEWHGQVVPEIVRSGNHQAIADWRRAQATEKTVLKHFDWLRQWDLAIPQRLEAAKYIPPHYVALMHGDVLLKDQQNPGQVKAGNSSVTSFDLHDIARSSLTYGLKNYFIVTPLQDQQQIVQTLLDFWHTPVGITYNRHRHEAVARVKLQNDLDEVVAAIEAQEGAKPLIIGTSARSVDHIQKISFYDQSTVWQSQRPVLFLFGTAKGIAPHIIDRCDYLLEPIYGFTDFNHLSVRAAASIVFDRWLGVNIRYRN